MFELREIILQNCLLKLYMTTAFYRNPWFYLTFFGMGNLVQIWEINMKMFEFSLTFFLITEK